jgi:hypothetical protein
MAILTTREVLLVGAIGGLTVLLGAVALRLAWLGLSYLVEHLIDRRKDRRALRAGRRRLRAFTTIDDLKE